MHYISQTSLKETGFLNFLLKGNIVTQQKEHGLWSVKPNSVLVLSLLLVRLCTSSLTSLNFSTPPSKTGTLTPPSDESCED